MPRTAQQCCAAFWDMYSSRAVFEVNTLLSVILPEVSGHSGLERWKAHAASGAVRSQSL